MNKEQNNKPENSNPKGNESGNRKDQSNTPGKGKPPFNFYWIYAILAILFIALQFYNWGGTAMEISQQRFENEMLGSGDVDKLIVVNRELVEVFIRQDKIDNYDDLREKGLREGPHFTFKIGSVDNFEKLVRDSQEDVPATQRIPLFYEQRKDWGSDILSWLLPIGLLIVFWIFIMRRMAGGAGGGQIFNIGKSKAQVFDKDTSVNVNFNHVAGLDEAKIELMEIVDFLKNPKKYTDLGGQIPKGALLVGPPGTGKTLLAKAVAGEAQVPFFSLSGSDFVEMFVGVGASRVRDLFKQAKEKAPCIIFIDEIDAIGRARGKNPMTGANDERENTLNQLLTEMDGFGTNVGVIILAATNRADILDRALLRAGRFDRQIQVEMPDLEERKAIFKVHMKPLKLAEDVKADFMARQTPGFSGADIANVCNEAALIAARRNKKIIERQDFLDAVDRIIGGLEKRNKIISPHEKKVIAFHESGHAATSWLLEYAHPLVKVTIVPRGKALGAAWYLPEERQITTYDQMFDEITSALGGRAAEEIIFNRVSTGALNDLEKITKQAYAMVVYFGLNKKIGNISYYDSSGQSEYSFNRPYSEKTAEIIDKEVSTLVESAYQRAKNILLENKDKLEKLANLLLEKEVIFREDLEEIFGKQSFKDEDHETFEEQAEEAESLKTGTDGNEKKSTSEKPTKAKKEKTGAEVNFADASKFKKEKDTSVRK
ncbi:MAG: ATP-dependent zinc metalloprotease FtsH [Bacteroidetes bacterium]|nr:MAG: ATP-dependent zinc metalloprotease FtsH [Bacteroidota bacterium]